MSPRKVEVDTNQYVGAHGKAPRGWGNWIFRIGTGPRDLNPIAWQTIDTFTRARLGAQQHAAARDMPYVQVCS